VSYICETFIKMKHIKHISELILKELSGTLSSEDKKFLEDWKNQSEHNKILYGRILSQSGINASFHIYKSLKSDQAFNRIIDKKDKPRRIIPLWTRYAAAVLMVAVLSGVWFYTRQAPVELTSQIISIPPGEFKAYLLTGNGTEYDLKDASLLEIKGQETVIVRGDEALTYNKQEIKEDGKKIEQHTLVVPRGGEWKLTLADGTKVWLNSESSLSYPEIFSGNRREVELKGEAFFEVAHNGEMPFIVQTGQLNIEVLGTEFNVRNYSDDEDLATTLLAGKVKVSSKIDATIQKILAPGQQAYLQKTDNKLEIRDVDAFDVSAWRYGRFVYRRESLGNIMNAIGRWYNVNIAYAEPTLKQLSFNVNTFRYGNVSEMLHAIEKTEAVQFERSGNMIIVKEKK